MPRKTFTSYEEARKHLDKLRAAALKRIPKNDSLVGDSSFVKRYGPEDAPKFIAVLGLVTKRMATKFGRIGKRGKK